MSGGTSEAELVERILAFEVDEEPGVPLGFRDRLARENGWSRAYAARVYDEYLRFLVLAATGASTPSDEVDQAWHLHLTYTRSYWDHLCGSLLGRPLHHGPTRGTADDGVRYREQYAATLDRYRSVFGSEPPVDIWPGVAERFRDPARWQRVDTRAHLVVRRAPVVAAGAAAVLVGGTTAMAADSDDGALLAVLVVVVLLAVVVGSVIVVATRRAYRAGRTGAPRRRWSDGGDAGAGGFWFFGGGGCGSDHDSGGCGGGGDSGGGSGCGSSGCGGGGGGCGGGGCGS